MVKSSRLLIGRSQFRSLLGGLIKESLMKFSHISKKIAEWVGTPLAFCLSILVVFLWALSGPFMNFSDTWQLVANTSTTIVTFWLVFVIQNTQNRDNIALHLKIDELILKMTDADNEFIRAEQKEESILHELDELHTQV